MPVHEDQEPAGAHARQYRELYDKDMRAEDKGETGSGGYGHES